DLRGADRTGSGGTARSGRAELAGPAVLADRAVRVSRFPGRPLLAVHPARLPALVRRPGAALALLIWVGGSLALRYSLSLSIGGSTIYGPLAAPIALLLWIYLVSIAVLVGAALNAALATSPPSAAP